MGQKQKGERKGVGEGKEGKGSFLSPPPRSSFHLFPLTPFFVRPECEISFPSYGNACYAGYKEGDLPRYDEISGPIQQVQGSVQLVGGSTLGAKIPR